MRNDLIHKIETVNFAVLRKIRKELNANKKQECLLFNN